MGKLDVVAAQKAAVLSGQDAALEGGLGACYDQGSADGVASVPASEGGFSQEQLNAAVASALAAAQAGSDQALADQKAASDAAFAADEAEDEKALVALQASMQEKLDALNAELVAMTAKEQIQELAVAAVKASILEVQAAFDAIKAILLPS